ncbi:Phenol 2-monooxygenase [Neonectria ditissima]|uniref:Phenol 2-monooxygenase n=1 Tax=Neonectria ditissima TaxID=78410 RepID=A0A0P7BS47_9HYPO|nr:Phenol 2-monooxygenase [Neonectria ditissima]
MQGKTTADHVDVLVVGAGPAGLMMATWLAKCGIKTRIVDKRGTKVFNGQADGLQCRTLEIFDSFGFGHRAWIESNHMLEICLWNPDKDGVIQRSSRIADTIPGISRFQQVVLHQGRIERFFLDAIKDFSNGEVAVERGVMPTSLKIDADSVEDPDAYPVTVQLRHLGEEESTPKQTATMSNGSSVQDGLFRSNMAADDTADLLKAAELNAKANTTEEVKAKYVVGADGAHSWVRKEIGLKLEGDSTDYIWGVLDIIPITDFPDIRMRCAIHSATSGSIMVIPRENKLVRLYIQLTTTEKTGEQDSRTDRSSITPEVILESAQRIIAPYKLSYRKLDWWTAYQIGQRVGSSFGVHDRVFLAGDAVHTHSPKAGQGMNVSMQDSYNLGWKIANVVKGVADRSILKTYETERKGIAHALINFDRKFSRLFSGRPARDIMDEEGISMEEFKNAFQKGNLFASGIAVDYDNSVIVSKPEEGQSDSAAQSLAPELKIGQRIPSVKVLNQSDARPWHLQELLRSNGTWRVILFPGDISKTKQKDRMLSLCQELANPSSFLKRFTPSGSRYDSIIEVLTVHAAKRTDVDMFDFPEVLRPYDEVEGWDYHKIFVDDQSYHEGHGQLYETFGIGREGGCVVVLRPDQYISCVAARNIAALHGPPRCWLPSQPRRTAAQSNNNTKQPQIAKKPSACHSQSKMYSAQIEAWIQQVIDPSSLPRNSSSRNRKRKFPHAQHHHDHPTGLSSPPPSNMNSSTSSDADPEATPRASIPSKRRRLANDAALNLHLQHPSEHLNDDPSTPTRSTKTSTTGASKSARSRSPVKNMADLALAEKPVRFTYLKSRGDLPADVKSLLNHIKMVGSGRDILPEPVVDMVQASLGLMDPDVTDDNSYSKNLWTVGNGSDVIDWDVNDEFKTLQKVARRTELCISENVSEASWNTRVHDLLLDVALTPFQGCISHWDVTRAPITKSYLPRHGSGIDLQAKMVDFCITLDGEPTRRQVVEHLRSTNHKSINHTDYQPLRFRPIAISIETKTPDGSTEEAKAQLSVWTSAYISRLRELTATSQKAAGLGITLPIINIKGGQWELLLAVDYLDRIEILQVGTIGDTTSVLSCYKLVAAMRWLAVWAVTVFGDWLKNNALLPISSDGSLGIQTPND